MASVLDHLLRLPNEPRFISFFVLPQHFLLHRSQAFEWQQVQIWLLNQTLVIVGQSPRPILVQFVYVFSDEHVKKCHRGYSLTLIFQEIVMHVLLLFEYYEFVPFFVHFAAMFEMQFQLLIF